jgi:hypothetical protein
MKSISEERVPKRVRLIGMSDASDIDGYNMKQTRHALARVRLEGTARRNEATVNLRCALRTDWEARETRWSARTSDELRKVNCEAAEWFSIIYLAWGSGAQSSMRGGFPGDNVAIHNIRVQRLNEIMFEIWGD